MGEWQKGYWAVLAAAAGFSTFAFLALSDFALVRGGLCVAAEPHCVREWLNALSGYFAIIPAAITIGVILYQVHRADENNKAQLRTQVLVQTIPQRALLSKVRKLLAWPIKRDVIELRKAEVQLERRELDVISLKLNAITLDHTAGLLLHKLWQELQPYDTGDLTIYLETAKRDVVSATKLWAAALESAHNLSIQPSNHHWGITFQEAFANAQFSHEYHYMNLVDNIRWACNRLDELLGLLDAITESLEKGDIA